MKQFAKHALVITTAAFAIAMVVARPAHAQDAPKAAVEAGYQYQWAKSTDDEEGTSFPGGWFADVTGRINNMWSWVGQVDGSYDKEGDDTLKLHSVDGGVRASFRNNPNYTPFVQGLIGYTRLSEEDFSSNGFNFDAGGGVIIPVGNTLGVKVYGGYRYHHFSSEGESLNVNGFRFGAGIDIPIGR